MTDKPTLQEVLDKLGITYRDYRAIKWAFMQAMEAREIDLSGQNWRNHTCRECGYCKETGTKVNSPILCLYHGEDINFTWNCPDFVPREAPNG